MTDTPAGSLPTHDRLAPGVPDSPGARRVKVGVVTPTLNAERFLERTLESIWAQESPAVEVEHVIVDGRSTDRTVEIAERYPSRVIVAEDGGMYEAVNRGMAAVEGEIVGYINADDEIARGALGRVAAALEREPAAQWVCGRLEYIDGDDTVLGAWTPVRMSMRSYAGIGWSCIPQQTVWVRRSFFERVGPYDTVYKNCADYDWYARAMRLSEPIILPEVMGRFRLHDSNLSYDAGRMRRESRMIQERYGGTGRGSYALGKLLSLRLNARNPKWLLAKRTGRITFTPRDA
ncbi:MAG TPA: glycosyltransferase family 2 protein [Actinomycetota bacterium]|nr:glycosyltransferase family 2 protein [Actinomycetota bacterium]